MQRLDKEDCEHLPSTDTEHFHVISFNPQSNHIKPRILSALQEVCFICIEDYFILCVLTQPKLSSFLRARKDLLALAGSLHSHALHDRADKWPGDLSV